ncbi:beta-phosphoglucomutase family hydrolase [Micrococcus luteus]|uniref:beta-phosphoglucomutase family hydrolase n=1 Tax=Micrococcus luteus TaxID=1270 RepID=UPI001303D88D|nr:beta-phosphoglucomutase family hydrolase [Micrococcus luteus]QGY91158.1 beta-phosphoglucomutase family hydrolase [Micrococcus luteus]
MSQTLTPAAPQDLNARRHRLRRYRAVIFDMDGVITDTAGVHAQAWKELFDGALPAVGALPANAAVVAADPDVLRPFDAAADYLHHVDGRPREDGVRTFFASRGLRVPEADAPEADAAPELTVLALAERKQGYFEQVLERDGVRVFPEAQDLLERLRAKGVPVALVTSSKNSRAVLTAGGVLDFFPVIVDGNTAVERGLPGKPDPAMFWEAARELGVDVADAMVLEDAVSGVKAAADGRFGLVIGVDREPELGRGRLKAAGAHLVVQDYGTLHLEDRTTTPFDPAWVLRWDHFDPASEGTREVLSTLANGYWGTRGAVPGTRISSVHYPGTYMAGVFNRLTSMVQGRVVETEHMVNIQDWTPLVVTPRHGRPLLPGEENLVEYGQEMDLRRGVLSRTMTFEDEQGRRTTVHTRQFTSLANRHLAAIELTVVAENWSGDLTVRSKIEGRVANLNVSDDRTLANQHLEPVQAREIDGETVLLETATNQSGIHVAVATRTRQVAPVGHHEPIRRPVDGSDLVVGQDILLHVDEGVPLVLEKVAAVATSHDHASASVWESAVKDAQRAQNFRNLLTLHEQRWGTNWDRFSVRIDLAEPYRHHRRSTAAETGGEYAPPVVAAGHSAPVGSAVPMGKDGASLRQQLALNLHTFHVLQTAYGRRRDLDASVGARGLHGEGYRGHIFWDEIYVYPMLTLRRPEITRGLLMYRYRRLNEARANAQAAGWAGAMYPWQSGADGSEETPTELWNPRSRMWMPDNSHNQRHVSLDIAYSVLRYIEITKDTSFISDYGAEMLVEISRFFMSMTLHNAVTDRYEIHGVMGPDEFHDGYPETPGSGLRNNAYTNVLTSWVLAETARLVRWLDTIDDGLPELMEISEEEIERWEEVSTRLTVPFFEEGEEAGILAQFEGYQDLLEFDWEAYRAKYGNIGRMDLILQAEGDATNRYKLSKQADTLMLGYLFSAEELDRILRRMGYELPQEAFERMVTYYEARSTHGSTLSRLVHAWVAARTDPDRSWDLFTEALESDLSDTQGGTTKEGIHLGLMAGTVDTVIRCYAGLETRDDVVRLHPRMPAQLPGARFTIRFRQQPVVIHMTQREVTVAAGEGMWHDVPMIIAGREHTLSPGEKLTVPLG